MASLFIRKRVLKQSQQNHRKLLATGPLVQPAPTGEPQRPLWLPTIHMRAQLLNSIQLSSTPWTAARQALLSVEFPGKNTGVGCHFLLQGIIHNEPK